ncbi:hypothetical protein BJG93_35230 [Paraburkholderia sprentiae WSM5005]|uniref:Uncharacterized protein n=1 Tax=Paraburkholderia sprentiae WSM5005 TaxID=754502 RepID=A0A8F4KIX7_9BURK|nr:hypothetical protein [Paraburkholderia sprentiae]QXE07197.1 hypothetical protein BJG93_35230 [Paraburkholderia sprentiae WSM5005]
MTCLLKRKLPIRDHEEQLRELAYLRMEAAYLKKLDALFKEQNQTAQKKNTQIVKGCGLGIRLPHY